MSRPLACSLEPYCGPRLGRRYSILMTRDCPYRKCPAEQHQGEGSEVDFFLGEHERRALSRSTEW